jgi:uncharacterized protein (DUF362 family)
MPEKSKVILRGVASRPLTEVVEELLNLCEWNTWLKPGDTVVIKPNCCTAVKEIVESANTDVALTEALCKVLLTRTDRVFVGESGHLRQNPWQAFAASGYDEIAKRLGITLVNFSESPTVPVDLEPIGKMNMPRQILESDAYINVPVLKTHAMTYFTGALKNQWGCVPDCRDRLRYHTQIELLLSSIQALLKPKFILMDGIVGMEGRGPVAGEARRLDLLLASRDAVAMDATAMRLVGLDPTKSRHVVVAAERGIGRFTPEEIDVDGPWDELSTQFNPPPADYANRAMFFATQYDWFVKYILGNDSVYYPVRDTVKALRRAMAAK